MYVFVCVCMCATAHQTMHVYSKCVGGGFISKLFVNPNLTLNFATKQLMTHQGLTMHSPNIALAIRDITELINHYMNPMTDSLSQRTAITISHNNYGHKPINQ